MIHLVSKAIFRPHRAPQMAVAAVRVRALRQHPHPTVRAIANACTFALHGQFSAEDRQAVDAVEHVRQAALRSTEKLVVEDFGAGSPGDHLTDNQMAQGRVVERTVGQACKIASKRPVEAALLWHLVRQFRPKACIELGCCVGISACYQGHALRLNGQGGQLYTLEGASAFAEVARRHFAAQQLTNVHAVVGRFQDTLEGVLERHGPIDYAFIDGHHDEHATVRYTEQILAKAAPRALYVFDDIAWSAGMKRAWQKIAADERFAVAIDCGELGVCATDSTLRTRVRETAILG